MTEADEVIMAPPRVDSPVPGRVSSPASTGGVGTFFEQHVVAHWLAQLLVRAIPPILLDCTIEEVDVQTEGLGWRTDDFLIVGVTASGEHRALAGQVKRSFTVSAADAECCKAFRDFWTDFKNGETFSPARDRLALVTSRGSNTLLEFFGGLVDAARASRDAPEFERRLTTPGLLNAKIIHYSEEIRAILGEAEGREVSRAELWPFLRVLHVLPLDLNTSTRQTEAAMKTLLAHTAAEHGAVAAAEATWNALLVEVGEGMPEARRYRLADLPPALRSRHNPVAGREHAVLQALAAHSALVFERIRTTIGPSLHLGRAAQMQKVLEGLQAQRIVMISGAAGSGKSSVAKDVMSILAADHYVFGFRAEEFARAHLDETLVQGQIPASASKLGAILANQPRKVLLVESVERLLEASTRDAFSDLLTLVSKDPSWHLVLTCRDYSVDLVRDGLLAPAELGCSVVVLPPLDDDELREVETAHPALAYPLAQASLRRLLRNPYVLDKALQVPWSEERLLPPSERAFRARVWQQVVRADQRAAAGMPTRRQRVFVDIALRRARALTLYAASEDLDAEVVDALRHDSLIVRAPEAPTMVAPSHDVLEDWAILQWIDDQYAKQEGSVRALSAALGGYPAIRRTYRAWATELVDRDPDAADKLLLEALADGAVPAHFRDDTIISLLRSSAAGALLERHRASLLANDKQPLRLVVRLLRVGCVTSPPSLAGNVRHPSALAVPDGPAWASVLGLVASALNSFSGDHRLVLGLVEDWANGVSPVTPYPDGAKDVAVIAHGLLPLFDRYSHEGLRKRVLRVVATIPKADPDAFMALLSGEGERRGDPELQKIVLEGLGGAAVARDMPEALASAAKGHILRSGHDARRGSGLDEVEIAFGVRSGRAHDYLPASAYHGPFLPLLKHHSRLGLEFVIDVFNQSVAHYVRARASRGSLEPLFEITLTFSDGTSKTQWCNGRLWLLYRGTSVGPYVLQSVLMALECLLLEVGDAQPRALDAILLSILRRSDSAALTGVVASLATAYPRWCGETLLVLLGCPACIQLDRSRLSQEIQAPSRISGFFPSHDAAAAIYESERAEADKLPHRQRDLEAAVLELQLRGFGPRVQQVLDQHRTALAPLEVQTERDRIWRLALHRMDLRRHQATVVDAPRRSAEGPEAEGKAKTNPESYVRLDLDVPESDLQEMVTASAADLQRMEARAGLLMWATKVFEGEQGRYDPAHWPERLKEAQAAASEVTSGEELGWGQGGPQLVAAVCVRDHWERMSLDEREWCVATVCAEVERRSDTWDPYVRSQISVASSEHMCASVVPLLLGRLLKPELAERIRRVFVLATTHPIEEVRKHAAAGIGWHLWGIDREMALRSVQAIATEALLAEQASEQEHARFLSAQRVGDRGGAFDPLDTETEGRSARLEAITAKGATHVRSHFYRPEGIAADAIAALDLDSSHGGEACGLILLVMRGAPAEPAAALVFGRVAKSLAQGWDSDDERRSMRMARQRDHREEATQIGLLADFVLRTPLAAATGIIEPVLAAVEKHPREVERVLARVISAEDRAPATAQFWSLWDQFAAHVGSAGWLARIDRERADGGELLSAIFLGSWWKDGVRHWRSLEGYADRVHALFEALPPSSAALQNYARMLYHVGEQSLPEAFVRIAAKLRSADPQRMLVGQGTIHLLEVLLQRHVYSRPLELKRRRDLRESVLFILDQMVEAGSSAAFRMRDDFVTPAPVE